MPSLSMLRVSVACALLTLTSAAMADRGGAHGHSDRHGDHMSDGGELQPGTGAHFGQRERRILSDYYRESAGGHCPPGLAKKGNGCLPPGQAKKWALGRPLPAGLEYAELPFDLRSRLPVPPAGYRYVRVASDILIVAIGSAMVIDAVQDIAR